MKNQHNHNFVVFTGPMWSSKTSKMLMTLERYKHQGKKIAVFKPLIDDRYSTNNVVSHMGWEYPANSISVGNDIIDFLVKTTDEPSVIAVDEAFMIPGIADVLIWLYRNGVNIVVSTLDLSATGKSFSEVEKILIWATHVEKCSAVCTVCGRDAFYTHKKMLNDDALVEIGGSELYEPRCARCHPSILNHEVVMNNPG